MDHPAIRQNRVAVITGAAVGIGYAIASRLSQLGMKVVLFDKDEAALDVAVRSLYNKDHSAQIATVTGDVTSPSALQELLTVAHELGEVSLVVNNAAISKGAGPWNDQDQWRKTMEINFWAVLAVQQLFVDHLLAQDYPAAIVNVGSKEGITTPPGNTAYSVSKIAVKVLTEHLEHELRERTHGRVSAHLLIPGYTFTPMNFPGMAADSAKPSAPWSADQVVARLLEGLIRSDFYIFCEDNEVSHELDQRRMQWNADDLIHNRPALSRWHPEYRDQFNAYISDVAPTRQVQA